MAHEQWARFAGTRHVCKLTGVFGDFDGYVQFPANPDGDATVYSREGSGQIISISVSLSWAINRVLEAMARVEQATFYYS